MAQMDRMQPPGGGLHLPPKVFQDMEGEFLD
jgi:hypothetical protein